MGKIKNKKLFVTIVSLIVVATLSVLFFGYWVMYSVIEFLTDPFPVYETTNINDYGVYEGNNNNEKVQEIINSFFPKNIGDNFENIDYSYKAKKLDAYGFEAYLEFTIEDPEEYAEFVSEYTEGIEGTTFPYDNAYTEYIIEDCFELTHSDDDIIDGWIHGEEGREDTFAIEYADIRKIICCPDEQRIIFVAIGVFDGGGTDAELLCTYFNRFDINPREYAHGREW